MTSEENSQPTTGADSPGLSREALAQLAASLEQNIQRRLSLDLWFKETSPIIRTDQDAPKHSKEMFQLIKQISSLHPAISVTPYDMNKFEKKANEYSISLAPTLIARSGGKSIRFTGIPAGTLFPAFIDALTYLTFFELPLDDEVRHLVEQLEEISDNKDPLSVELYVTPYDTQSAQQYGLFGIAGAATKSISVTITEIAEYPIAAQNKLIDEVPLVTINGKRFVGMWTLEDLLQQILHIAQNEDVTVVREQVISGPYISEDEALRLAADANANPNTQESGFEETSSGLVIPR